MEDEGSWPNEEGGEGHFRLREQHRLHHVRIYIIYPLVKGRVEVKVNSRMEQDHVRIKTAILRWLDLTQNTVRILQNFVTEERCDIIFFLSLF